MKQRSLPKISSINEILGMNLIIPNYQRPYKWSTKNITDLILDTQKSIEYSHKYINFKYRIGTVILHKNENNEFEIVDGQQRLLSLLLLKIHLQPDFTCSLQNVGFSNKTTQRNLHNNYVTIREWFSSVKDYDKNLFIMALENILEVVVIIVDKIDEAFQLFDSQNSRGRALYPHDLLKAYHLREIQDKYEMQDAVTKWESKKPEEIRELFDLYLYPLWNWSKCKKSSNFTVSEIDIYKGISLASGYTYARRANKAMPYFLLSEPFISGSDFFEMVNHYMRMLRHIKEELISNTSFKKILNMLTNGKKVNTIEELDCKSKSSEVGLNYARNLFYCAFLCYYDRFHNFDAMAIKKLFTWAMMIRVDMEHLGFDTINLYAIGGESSTKYTNVIPVIAKISYARQHTEISTMKLKLRENNEASSKKWNDLYRNICELNDYK